MDNLTIEQADDLVSELINIKEKSKKSAKFKSKYERLLNYCAKQFDYIVINKAKKYKSFSNYEDLLQDGRVALVLAMNSYNPDKGCFYYWVNQYVKTKISREANKHSSMKVPIKHAKKDKPYKVSFSYARSINGEGCQESSLDILEKNELKDSVKAAVAKLPFQHKKVIEMSFDMTRNNYSISKICDELDITKQEFNKLLNNAKKMLKNDLLSGEV